jgi:hypothetical protein
MFEATARQRIFYLYDTLTGTSIEGDCPFYHGWLELPGLRKARLIGTVSIFWVVANASPGWHANPRLHCSLDTSAVCIASAEEPLK